MALKQASFNFDFFDDEPSASKVEEGAQTENKAVEEASNSEPLEVDIRVEQTDNVSVNKKAGRGRMRIADMDADALKVEIPEDEILFQKRYYSMGEVTEMFKVNHSLIRYWESEFKILKPKKNGKGDRFFRPEDVKNLRLIYHLLRERKYTIEGAKSYLKHSAKIEAQFKSIEAMKRLRRFLSELKNTL
jgi:DNA-binding transcriptional MerR regulator